MSDNTLYIVCLGPKFFNCLPNDIKQINNFRLISNKVKTWLVDFEDLGFLLSIIS